MNSLFRLRQSPGRATSESVIVTEPRAAMLGGFETEDELDE